jgi:hypothetical protein
MTVPLQYNGSTVYTANPAGSSCPVQSQNTTYPYQLRIGNTGSIPGANYTRAEYDANPFYLTLYYINVKGAFDTSTENLTTAGDVSIKSSDSFYQYGQPWKLNATKSTKDGEEGYDIAGELITHKYNGDQKFWFRIGNCASTFESWVSCSITRSMEGGA